MLKVLRLLLLFSLSLFSVACATPEEKPVFEPGCLDVIICSEPQEKNQG
jgi:hypothetical protein